MSDRPPDDDSRREHTADVVKPDEEVHISRMQDDISRLRSVLFMLVKDQPDLLRLLEPPKAQDEQSQK